MLMDGHHKIIKSDIDYLLIISEINPVLLIKRLVSWNSYVSVGLV